MPKLPSKATGPEFDKLKAKWYKKLKRSGFKDIEHGRDLNNMAGQTFRQSGNDSVVLTDFERIEHDTDDRFLPGWDQQSQCHDTAKYEYYDRIVTYAGTLPEGDRVRKFLILTVQTSRSNAARKVRYSMVQATSIWQATLQQLGLPDGRRGPGKREAAKAPEPASPVRILKREEIAKLQYKAPKQIKDGTDE